MTGRQPGAAAARHQAEAILHEPRFHGSSSPHPLRPVLMSLGHLLETVANGLEQAISRLGAHLPGGTAVAWALVILLVGVISAALARLIGGRRFAQRRSAGPLAGLAPTAATLEAHAAAAEREHHYELALRLRFRAGLVGLAERDRVASPATAVSAQLAQELGSEDFDALAARFDEIVYGGRPAHEGDVEDARLRWPSVLSGRRFR